MRVKSSVLSRMKVPRSGAASVIIYLEVLLESLEGRHFRGSSAFGAWNAIIHMGPSGVPSAGAPM